MSLKNKHPWSELLKPNCGVWVNPRGCGEHGETNFDLDDILEAAVRDGLDVDRAEMLGLALMSGVGCPHCGEKIDTDWIEQHQVLLRAFLRGEA